MTATAPLPTYRKVVEFIAATAVYAACAYFLLAPLFDHPGSTLLDTSSIASWLLAPNTDLFIWVLSWDWHSLTTQPSSFWNANILSPMQESLTAVFPRLGHLPVFGPVAAITGNAVEANQINLLANFALSGGALYALMRHWGVSRPAAFFAGFVYALCPSRVSSAATPSLVAGQYLPLGILFVDRAAANRSWGDSLIASLFLIWQAFSALAYAYLVPLIGLVYIGLAPLRSGRERLDLRVLMPFAASLVAVGFLIAPTVAAVSAGRLEAPNTAGFLELGAAGSWADYLSRSSFFKGGSRPNAIATPLYVGWITLALVVVGIVRGAGAAVPRWLKQVLLASTALAVVLTFGPAGTVLRKGWEIFGKVVPGASTLLLPSHFGMLFVLTASAFAGLGLDRALAALSPAALRLAVAVAVLAATGWELRLGATGIEVSDRSPYPSRVYSLLRDQPDGALLEIPFDSCRLDSPIAQARTMFDSTSHWRPILNGFGELRQSSHDQLLALTAALPDVRALDLLARIADLRHIIARTSQLSIAERRTWLGTKSIREVGYADGRLLLEVGMSRHPSLTASFRNLRKLTTTLRGIPVGPVPESGRIMRASAEFDLLGSAPGIPVRARVTVQNPTDQGWPVLGGNPDEAVQIAYRWERLDGTPFTKPRKERRTPLPFDLAPGESVTTNICVIPPAADGPVYLVVGVAQGDEWFDGPVARAGLVLRAFDPDALP